MAANVINFQLVGFAELEAKLVGLGPKVAKRVVKKAVTAAAEPIARIARRGTPVGTTGLLRISIAVKTKQTKSGAYVVIGPKHNHYVIDGKPHDPFYYAHLVEYGTKPHMIAAKDKGILSFLGIKTKIVNHPGAKAQPFLRPAFYQGKAGALVFLARELEEGITREAMKTA